MDDFPSVASKSGVNKILHVTETMRHLDQANTCEDRISKQLERADSFTFRRRMDADSFTRTFGCSIYRVTSVTRTSQKNRGIAD